MKLVESIDEIVALCMSLAGIAVLLFGTYAIFYLMSNIAIEELLLISGALLGPATGYLFGKSVPKHESNDIKDVLMQSISKP